MDSHPTHWRGDADLSLQIRTQLQSHRKALRSGYFLFCPITILPFSLPLFFLSSSRHAPSCLWRPDRRTQAVLIGVDRWLCATEASRVMAEPVVFTKANVCPKTHTHPPRPNRTIPANMPQCPSTLAFCNACLALFIQFCRSPWILIPFLFCYLPLFHPPYTPPLLCWPSADLTRADYYLRVS